MSVRTRQLIFFMMIILFCISFMTLVYRSAVESAREAVVDKMNSQGEYFQDALDAELNHIFKMKINLILDRKMPYVINKDLLITDYERRDALLSIKESMQSICNTSKLIKTCDLYLPNGSYHITEKQIYRFEDEDYVTMRLLQNSEENQINFIDHNIVLISAANTMSESQVPEYLIAFTLNPEEIIHRMNALSNSQGSGAFIYMSDIDLLLENEDGELADNIVSSYGNTLAMNQGETFEMNGMKYIAFVTYSEQSGYLVQYALEDPVLAQLKTYRAFLIVFILLLGVFTIIFSKYTEQIIHRPLLRLLAAFDEVKNGKLDVIIEGSIKDEFSYIYDGFHDMETRLDQYVKEVYFQKNLAQKAELKQLQAQINPHFLYNSFFILSRRIKKGDMQGAEEIANHLGYYFKFLTRNTSDCVSLKEEVAHAESYAAIQSARFRGRVNVVFEEIPHEYFAYVVPRLILQPVIENALDHGLDNKEEGGILHISFNLLEHGIELIVEDNGDEVSDEQLMKIQDSLIIDSEQEITAIININMRLNNYFDEKAGLKLERSELGGIKTVIWLPERKE